MSRPSVAGIQVIGPVRHRVPDSQLRAELVQPRPVGLTVAFDDLRMGPPGHRVGRRRVEVLQLGERPQRPLDALAGAEQTPGQQVWVRRPLDGWAGVIVGAVGDDGDLGGIHRVPDEQPISGGIGHRDHRGGRCHDLLQQRLLRGGRIAEDGVQHHDAGNREPAQQRRDLVAVSARIDAVLVLNDRHVIGVEGGRRLPPAGRGTRLPGVHDAGSGTLVVTGDRDAHGAVRRAVTVEVRGQGGVERRQPAAGRRTGAQEAVIDGLTGLSIIDRGRGVPPARVQGRAGTEFLNRSRWPGVGAAGT